jgi:alpha-mannosidase
VGNQASRGREECDLIIESWVALRRGSRSLEITTRFVNTAENHRLRVFFPTHCAGKTCHAETAFDVVERETVFDEDSVWQGAGNVTFPMQRFVDVSDDEGGLAFLSPGLHEYEITQGQERCIAVTLLRAYEVNLTTVSFRWEKHEEMKLAQCPGVHEFSYRIHPHAGNYASGGVLEQAEAMVAPLEPVQSGVSRGDLPKRMGFLDIDPGILQMSACKQAADGNGWILRLYNPTPERISGTITIPSVLRSASLVSLEENHIAELSIQEGKIAVDAAPKKIISLRLN